MSSSAAHRAVTLIAAATAAAVVVAIAVSPSAAIAASPLTGTGPITYQTESMKAFEHQLADGEIHAMSFNYVAHHLHLELNDGQFKLVDYPPAQTNHLVAEIKAKGIPIVVDKTTKVTKPVHHVLRYVIGAIVIVVIVIILLVLLMGRRRSLAAEEVPDDGQARTSPSPPDVT